MKKTAAILLMFFSLLCFSSCENRYTEICPGKKLPTFEFSAGLSRAKLPENAEELFLTDVYKSDAEGEADVYIFRYGKEDGMTLEDFGNMQAGELKVFCNMTSFKNVPAANIIFFDDELDGERLIRSYIFEDEDDFVKVCLAYKTVRIRLGESDYTVGMIEGYSERDNAGIFPYEKVYEYKDEYLPTVRIRQFSKDHFTRDTYDADLMPGTSREKYETYAADGWTEEEFISLYGDSHKLLKGELISRNGLDAGFLGYIENGVFYVRALVDCGDSYVMICAENDAAIFQHVVNALIDTIK